MLSNSQLIRLNLSRLSSCSASIINHCPTRLFSRVAEVTHSSKDSVNRIAHHCDTSSAPLVSSSTPPTVPPSSSSKTTSSKDSCIYQHTFGSYQKLIRDEKENAKNLVLIEDKTLSFKVGDKGKLEKILDSPVTRFWDYWVAERHYLLVDLADRKSFTNKSQAILSEAKFPIESRFFSLNKIPNQGDDVGANRLARPKNRFDLKLYRQSVKSADKMNENNGWEEMVRRFTMNIVQSELECKLKFFIIVTLEDLLCQGIFNAFELAPFGSSVNGLGWGSSGLDLCLSNKHEADPNPILVSATGTLLDGAVKRQRCIKMYTSLMKFDLIPGVGNANQPNNQTVKLFFNISANDVTITCADPKNLELFKVSELLYQISSADERILSLFHFCKLWAEVQGLICQTFNNLMLTMIIINYLQVQQPFPILPPLEPFFRDSKARITALSISDKTSSFDDILSGFFRYLGTFDFSNSGANLFLGKNVRKATRDPLFILDPAKGNNMASRVTKKDLENLTKTALKSYRLLGAGCHPKLLMKPITNEIYKKIVKN